jgi:hypothetical protein
MAIERFPVFEQPRRNLRARTWAKAGPRRRGDALGQQSPELRMMPAEVMSGTVAMRAGTSSQTLHLVDQLVPVHLIKIIIPS